MKKRVWSKLAVFLIAAMLAGAMPASASDITRGFDLSSLAGLADSEDVSSGLNAILELLGMAEHPIKDCKISQIADQTYTGSPITPVPTITYNGTRLKKGTDYTLSYSNNTKVGTAKVTIRGKGTYTGSKTISFEIVRKNSSSGKSSSKSSSSGKSSSKSSSSGKSSSKSSSSGKSSSKSSSGSSSSKSSSGKNNKAAISSASSPAAGALKVTWKKKSGADGYQIVCSTNKDFTSNVKEVYVEGGSKTTETVEGLNTGKNYYVKVRAYKKVGTTYWYSDFSNSRSVKVK